MVNEAGDVAVAIPCQDVAVVGPKDLELENIGPVLVLLLNVNLDKSLSFFP